MSAHYPHPLCKAVHSLAGLSSEMLVICQILFVFGFRFWINITPLPPPTKKRKENKKTKTTTLKNKPNNIHNQKTKDFSWHYSFSVCNHLQQSDRMFSVLLSTVPVDRMFSVFLFTCWQNVFCFPVYLLTECFLFSCLLYLSFFFFFLLLSLGHLLPHLSLLWHRLLQFLLYLATPPNRQVNVSLWPSLP